MALDVSRWSHRTYCFYYLWSTCKLKLCFISEFVSCSYFWRSMPDAKLEMQKLNGRVALPISPPHTHDCGGGGSKEDSYFRVQLSLKLSSVPDFSSLHQLSKVHKLPSKASIKMNRTGIQTGHKLVITEDPAHHRLPTSQLQLQKYCLFLQGLCEIPEGYKLFQ